MQKVTILCVGKLKEKFYADAVSEYTKRLSRYCKLEIIELSEERLPEAPSPAQIDAALSKEADAIRRVVASHYDAAHYQATPEEEQALAARPDIERCNTNRSTYVWLPLTFRDGKPEIVWHDTWKWEDFA